LARRPHVPVSGVHTVRYWPWPCSRRPPRAAGGGGRGGGARAGGAAHPAARGRPGGGGRGGAGERVRADGPGPQEHCAQGAAGARAPPGARPAARCGASARGPRRAASAETRGGLAAARRVTCCSAPRRAHHLALQPGGCVVRGRRRAARAWPRTAEHLREARCRSALRAAQVLRRAARRGAPRGNLTRRTPRPWGAPPAASGACGAARQGQIWHAGFGAGELRAELFRDVPDALVRWRAEGLKTYIYSSGSRQAQADLFGHTTAGDLRPYLSGFFDTTSGLKVRRPCPPPARAAAGGRRQ